MKKFNILFILILIIVSCEKDYKKERKEWALQYRNKIQQDFKGYSSYEQLLIDFIKDVLNDKDINHYFLTNDEYLKVYWANEPWEKIYDKGMTNENVVYIYNIFLFKNLTNTIAYIKNNLKAIKSNENFQIQIQEEKYIKQEGIDLIYFNQLDIIQNNKTTTLQIKGVILKHNEQYKILNIRTKD